MREKNGDLVIKPVADHHIEGMAGMTGTKGKLLRALKEEKSKERSSQEAPTAQARFYSSHNSQDR
jgi:hypothetical protein